MVLKSYEVSEESAAEVEKVLAEGQKKYASIAHIICECPFEGELEDE